MWMGLPSGSGKEWEMRRTLVGFICKVRCSPLPINTYLYVCLCALLDALDRCLRSFSASLFQKMRRTLVG